MKKTQKRWPWKRPTNIPSEISEVARRLQALELPRNLRWVVTCFVVQSKPQTGTALFATLVAAVNEFDDSVGSTNPHLDLIPKIIGALIDDPEISEATVAAASGTVKSLATRPRCEVSGIQRPARWWVKVPEPTEILSRLMALDDNPEMTALYSDIATAVGGKAVRGDSMNTDLITTVMRFSANQVEDSETPYERIPTWLEVLIDDKQVASVAVESFEGALRWYRNWKLLTRR